MIEKKCDIVVLGGGGSGLVAAAKAAEAPGVKVIVLEKSGTPGGGMLFASTMRTFQSRWQEERNIPDQSNDFIRKGMDLTLWKLDPELVKRAVLGTGKFFDWYSQYEKPEVLEQYEARPYVFDIPEGGQPGPQIDGFHKGSGKYIVETMIRRCKELGVEIITRCRVRDADVSDNKISAVIAESAEGPMRISCSACIMASGSWIRNKEIVDKVMPRFNDMDVLPSAHQNPAYTGDFLPIALKAGAFIDWESFCLRIMGPICSLGDRSDFDTLCRLDTSVLVDLNAKRFVAEPMVPRIDPFDTGHVLINHPKGKTFFLFSSNIFERAIEASRDNGEKKDFDMFAVPTLPPLEEINKMFKDKMAKGTKELGMADTIEELAAQIGLDSKTLKKTVDEYNDSCAEGLDWNFFKEPDKMLPLSKPPFYAIGAKLSTDGAFGGVRVNSRMQAYKEGGGLVDALYVTGDIASGRHIVVSGIKRQVLNDMSWALSSGFIAGCAAVEDLKGTSKNTIM